MVTFFPRAWRSFNFLYDAVSFGFVEPYFFCSYDCWQLEQRVNEIEQFYLNSSKKQSTASQKSLFVKDKDKVKHIPGYKKYQQEAARRDAAAAKRMQDIMRHFGSILRQVISCT